MAEHVTHDYEAPAVPLNLGPLRSQALLAAAVGFVAWIAFGLINFMAYNDGEPGGLRDFFLTYQIGYVFWMFVPIGSMALLLLAYMTSASWGLVFRRIFQAATRTLPVTIALFIVPAIGLYMNKDSQFWWIEDVRDNPEYNSNPSVLHEQLGRQISYLNFERFLLTALAVFTIYLVINSCLNKWGLKSEDEKDYESWVKLRKLAGPGFILWALTFTIIITDWVMSVEPSWSSTMFPVVAAMDSFLTTFAFSALLFYSFVGRNAEVLEIIKPKFRIDIGSLMFGFTMVWAYASFSQYMLIWAGNMPEEIIYYKKRLNGGWEYMAYLLMIVHWFLPFIILLFREVKTDPRRMRWMTTMLLAIVAVDVIWWILPAYPHVHGWAHVPMAISAIVGIGGVWVWFFLGQLGVRDLLPKKDTEFLATWGEHH